MKSWSMLNATLLINGLEIDGYAEGDDVIRTGRINDSSNHITGADGNMTVSISADRTGFVEVDLLQSSTSNAVLTALVVAQEGGILVPITLLYKDTQGSDLISGSQGYMKKPADADRGTNANAQTWRMEFEKLNIGLAGSSNV